MARSSIAVLVLCFAAISLSHAASDFCSNYLAVTTTKCPAPSTVNTIDISKYLGRWYEMGATAVFRFESEDGLACGVANYTALGKSDGLNKIQIFNRGLIAVEEDRRKQVESVARSSIRISRLLRRPCIAAVGVAAAAKRLGSAGKPLSKLADSVSSLAAEADRQLEAIVFANAALNEANRPPPGGVRRYKARIQRAVAQMDGVLKMMWMDGMKALNGTLAMSRQEGLPKRVMESIMELQGGGLTKAITGMAGSAGSISRVAGRMYSARKDPFGVNPFRAVAEQNPMEAGKLGIQIPFAPPFVRANYWVIDLKGEASKGYERAVVYSCQRGIVVWWIIARKPEMSMEEIEEVKKLVKSKGIHQTGVNPFLVNDFASPRCRSFYSGLVV